MTTARKALSIAVSFIFFTKPFTMQYLWSGLIIVIGIYLNIYSKRSKVSITEIVDKARRIFLGKSGRRGIGSSQEKLLNV